MKHSLLLAALLSTLALIACEKPTVVNGPAATVAVPGPAGPQGATGSEGVKGDTGSSGAGTTVVVTPPAASAPTN